MIKKLLWNLLGFASLGMAYIGLITPGIPYSCFVVAAAYCFARGNKRMHDWIYAHKVFGPFLTNWSKHRVFPTRMKFFMLAMMSSSLIIMYFTGVKLIGIISTACFMAIVAVWAWRFPGSIEEHEIRKDTGRRIGWFNDNF